MKKIQFFPLLIFALMVFQGCFTATEEIWLNLDQSGKVVYKMDKSKFLESLSPLTDQLKALSDSNTAPVTTDETYVLFDFLHDTLKQKLANANIAKRITVRKFNNQSANESFTTYAFEFKNSGEIQAFRDVIFNFSETSEDTKSLIMQSCEIAFDGRNFTLKGSVPDGKAGPTAEDLASPQVQMMKKVLDGAKYRFVVHLPGEVEKVSGEGFSLEKNTVSAEFDWFEPLFNPEKVKAEATMQSR